MKKKLNKNEVVLMKFTQEDIYEFFREYLFSHYKEYANINSKNIISSVRPFIENDNSCSIILALQSEENLYDGKTNILDKLDNDKLSNLNLNQVLQIFSFDNLKQFFKVEN